LEQGIVTHVDHSPLGPEFESAPEPSSLEGDQDVPATLLAEQDAQQALVPIEQRTIVFYEDQILAAVIEEAGQRQVYVPVKPISDYLGLAWPPQFQRIQRDEVLAEVARLILLTMRSGPGNPVMLALPIEYLHGWLFGIQASRVREDLREKITRYRRECYHKLWEAFQADRPMLSSSTAGSADQHPLAYAKGLAMAVATLADQQMLLEGRVENAEGRLNRAAEVVGALGRRLGGIEQRLLTVEDKFTPATLVTAEQAAEIAAAVKALAELLTRQAPATGKNHYQGIFQELYRRFQVSSYHNIRLEDYSAVLAFLADWHQHVSQAGGQIDASPAT
jgi:hypothetical protein